ncbi:MAG: DUF724 domain-containing protein [Kocuria sp.]|nr:DUF724 domain-containing protein [Kocuria sp.]
MSLDDLAPYLIPSIATVVAGWLALKPKKTDPSVLMQDELKRLNAKLEGQDEKISSLQQQVSLLWSQKFAGARHISRLEVQVEDLGAVPLERPPEVKELFEP